MDKILAPIKQRILDYIENEGFVKKEFFAKTDLSPSNFKGEGRKSELGGDKIAKILTLCPNINSDWLLTGRGEMLVSEKPDAQPVKNYQKLGCPYFNVDFQGGFDLFYNNQTAIPEYFIDFSPYNKDGALWCNVSGKSMEPEISNGDMVLIKEVPAWQDYIDFDDIYGIVTSNGFRTIKRVKKGSSNATFTLVPANPDFESQEINKEMIMHIFKVLCAIKKF